MAARRTLSLEMLVKALAMKYEGKTYEEIARSLGCSRSTVVRWLPQFEKNLRNIYPPVKGVERETINEGKIFEEIKEIKRKLDEIEKITLKLLQCIS